MVRELCQLGLNTLYCTVDFRQFCVGVARSYRVSANNVVRACRGIVDWRPDKLYWKATTALILGEVAIISSAILAIHVLFTIALYLEGSAASMIVMPVAFLSILVAIALLFISGLFVISKLIDLRDGSEFFKREMLEVGWEAFTSCNPVVLPFLLLFGLAHAMETSARYLWSNGPRLARDTMTAVTFLIQETGRFAMRIFVYIHTELRTLCFVDAAIGATAGFFLGSAIACAVIGAILGVVNYEIVSVKWLKLVPARAK